MRKEDEVILMSGGIEILITKITGNQVHLGIKAPDGIKIFRKELLDESEREERLNPKNE